MAIGNFCYYGRLVWDTQSLYGFEDQYMTHLCQGSMIDIFASAYWFARSLSVGDIKYFTPTPSTTSSASPYSSSVVNNLESL